MKDEADTKQKSTKVTPSLLEAFDFLKGLKDDDKLVGGAKIISQLHTNENEKDIQYVVKRLVRSLGANVPDLRTGYYATLVNILIKYDQVTVAQLLELVKNELHANGSSKSEVGDVALGQILVCSAIFRSGLMLRCSEEEQKRVIQVFINASKKKSYLGTVAYLILLDFAKGLDEDKFGTIVWENIKPDLKKEIKEHTLDSLHFLLVVNKEFPKKVKLTKLIGVPEILCEDNVHTVCEKLMAGIDFSSVNHPIYNEVAIHMATSPLLHTFWASGIDSQLVKHNRNRELVALNMLTTIFKNMKDNAEAIPELLSKNFFKLFMDWFKGLQTASKIRSKNDDEDDQKLMIKKERELLLALAAVMKHDDVTSDISVDVLKKLLFNPGEINFAEISGTTIIRSIVADLDKDAVKKMAKLFKAVLLNKSKKVIKEDAERAWYNNERVKAADLLSYLVSHEAVKEDTDFKLSYMKILMCFGFFKIGGDENLTVSNELSGLIKTCFYRCFTSRFSNVDSLVTVLSSLCSFICSIMKKEEIRVKMEKQFPEENMECWEMLTSICLKLESIESKSKIDKVFLILLYQLGLFLFSEPTHVKMARSSIKELKSCYEHYRKSKKKKVAKAGDLMEEPEWIEVLVEVLLSILSTESSVLRSVVQCVFRLLWEDLTPSAIGQIVSVLDPESESNPLTHDGESNDDEESTNEEENSDENDENDESDSPVEDEDEDDDDMKVPDQLRLAVQKALGSTNPDSDAESLDADMIDEEEGKKLDEALAEAFKQFNQGKSKKSKKDRKDKKSLSDFRIRVLDLVDIYLEKDPSMDICLGMIAPLTRCLEFCIADSQFRELENRVRKTIKTLTKIKKFANSDDVTFEELCEYLKANIEKGGRSHFMFQALGDVITYFATFIIHCSQKITMPSKSPKKGKPASPLVEIFKEAIQSYFQNRNCMLPIIFFHNVLQTEWEGTYDLVPLIVQNIFDNNVRQFRRNEGLDLMAGFYRALKRTKPTSTELITKLNHIEDNFQKTLVKAFKIESGFQVKNNFFEVLKKVLKSIKDFHDTCKVPTNMNFKVINEIITSSKNHVITNKTQVNEEQNGNVTGKEQRKKKNKKRKAKATGLQQEHPPHKKIKKVLVQV